MENILNLNQYLLEMEETDAEAVDMEDVDGEEGDEEVYEALRRTAKQEAIGNEIRVLMMELNKNERYSAAKEKFLKLFRMESKRIVKEKGLHPNMIKQMTKVKLRLDEL